MNTDFSKALEELRAVVRDQEKELRATKRVVNRMCERQAMPVEYPDAEREIAPNPRQFSGLPLATAMKKHLEARHEPATVNEIYDALIVGGLQMKARNVVNAKRALYISLGKNSRTFRKLPGDPALFGLSAWYQK